MDPVLPQAPVRRVTGDTVRFTRDVPQSTAVPDGLVSRLVHQSQDWLASSLGVDPTRRPDRVVAMLTNNVRRAPGYWIQLFMATGIATLGLALNSTAVIIGAMLVSPLMGPIVELGMGFAVGSALLVLRSGLRVVASVGSVIVTAAAITLTLPFHEVTSEITARTAPTLLDLLIAIFCALIAAYSALRQSSDTAAAAAGTAIGIALVPPLCVVGFGLGTGDSAVAGGSLLLFVANLSAILVFAVVLFFLLGFGRVDAAVIERNHAGAETGRTAQLTRRAHAGLRQAFGSRYGLAMRLLVPALFLLVVYLPLSRALDDVSWQFRVRRAVTRLVSKEAPNAVQSALQVERGTVSLRLLVVGGPADAARLERTLATGLAAASGVTPSVTVVAVENAGAMAARRATAGRQDPIAPPDLSALRQRVAEALVRYWPSSAGILQAWTFQIGGGAAPVVTVRHLGVPLGPAADMLGQRLSEAIGAAVSVEDAPLPSSPLAATAGAPVETTWLLAATALLDQVGRVPGFVACVTGPTEGRRADRAAKAILAALQSAAAERKARLSVADAPTWSVRVAAETCDDSADAAGAKTP